MRALHTPQQETNSAYNPGVAYQGGQFLAQGISQAGGALADGLQRYAQNREEAAALDTRFQSTAEPLMQKLKLYGQLADETSPAAALLDKAADWHKLGTSQKKVLLADMLLLGDKAEAEQQRKEAEQYKRLEIQDRQAQFAEVQKQHQIANDRNWKLDALAAGQRSFENVRQLSADARAEQDLGLRKDIHTDTLARFGRAEAERRADRNAYRALMQFSQPLLPGEQGPMPSVQFNASRAMQQTGGSIPPEDLAALEKMGRISRVGTMTDIAGDPTGKFLWQADNAGYRVDTGQSNNSSAQMPASRDGYAPFPDGKGGVTWKPIKPVDSAAGADPKLAGALAELLEMKKRGVKEAKLGEGGKVHEGGMMTFGEQPIDEVIARVRAQLGNTGAPASGPAAGNDDKVVVEKDGKKFRLPKGQLEDAKRQGYKLSQ